MTSAVPALRSTTIMLLPVPVVMRPPLPRAASAWGTAPKLPSGMIRSGPGAESGSRLSVCSPALRTARTSWGGGVEGVVAAQAPARTRTAQVHPRSDSAIKPRIILHLAPRAERNDVRCAILEGRDGHGPLEDAGAQHGSHGAGGGA